MQFGINKNLLLLIPTKLHSKSFDYLYKKFLDSFADSNAIHANFISSYHHIIYLYLPSDF